jgi:hypothetical protein
VGEKYHIILTLCDDFCHAWHTKLRLRRAFNIGLAARAFDALRAAKWHKASKTHDLRLFLVELCHTANAAEPPRSEFRRSLSWIRIARSKGVDFTTFGRYISDCICCRPVNGCGFGV